jgi:hypothetical protein
MGAMGAEWSEGSRGEERRKRGQPSPYADCLVFRTYLHLSHGMTISRLLDTITSMSDSCRFATSTKHENEFEPEYV